MSNKASGVSMTMFIAGIVIAILASSALSTVIVSQFVVGTQGPAGLQGDEGAQGPAGPTGDTGPQGSKGDTGDQGPKGDVGPEGPTGGFGAPDYDSSWVPLSAEEASVFEPQLGPLEDLFVYIVGRSYVGEPFNFWVYHQHGLGQDTFNYQGVTTYDRTGALWESYGNDTIRVYRGADDLVWDEVRVRIWQIS